MHVTSYDGSTSAAPTARIISGAQAAVRAPENGYWSVDFRSTHATTAGIITHATHATTARIRADVAFIVVIAS